MARAYNRRMIVDTSPATLAGRLLYEPLAPWLARCAGGWPDHDTLGAWAAQAGAASGGGAPIRFVAPVSGAGYEARIHERGEVDTRPGNWHDLFNALVWCAFPRAKAALNARHHGALHEARDGRRGARRDAATQFDECGAVLAGCRPDLLAALRAHRWREVLWARRAELLAGTRLVVFGHATFDALRRPFHGLCVKWLAMPVAADFIAAPVAEQVAEVDRWLAARLAEPGFLAHPRAAAALPLLGWPGLVAASEDPAWYEDTSQFRPARIVP